jgi:hypothetical protein
VNNREMRRRLIAVKEAAVEDEAMMTRERERLTLQLSMTS